MRVGLIYWADGDGISEAIRAPLCQLGHSVEIVRHDERLPKWLDTVLIQGPSAVHSIIPVVSQLQAIPPAERPVLIYWQHEGMPDPGLPDSIARPAAVLRSWSRRVMERAGVHGRPPFSVLYRRMTRLRYYGDLLYLRQKGMLDVLVTPSEHAAIYLTARGFSPMVAYIYGEDWGTDLRLVRDVPVLWIGAEGTRWRREILRAVRRELKASGVEVLWVDGVELPAIYGARRTELLNRTRIVLNVPRAPWDDNYMRALLAILNRALTVSVPMSAPTPLVPGRDLVEAEPERIAESVLYYLGHEAERAQIAESAYRFVTTELPMARSVGPVMARVAQLRGLGRFGSGRPDGERDTQRAGTCQSPSCCAHAKCAPDGTGRLRRRPKGSCEAIP